MLYVSQLVTPVQNRCPPSPDLCSATYYIILQSNDLYIVYDETTLSEVLSSNVIIATIKTLLLKTFPRNRTMSRKFKCCTSALYHQMATLQLHCGRQKWWHQHETQLNWFLQKKTRNKQGKSRENLNNPICTLNFKNLFEVIQEEYTSCLTQPDKLSITFWFRLNVLVFLGQLLKCSCKK